MLFGCGVCICVCVWWWGVEGWDARVFCDVGRSDGAWALGWRKFRTFSRVEGQCKDSSPRVKQI